MAKGFRKSNFLSKTILNMMSKLVQLFGYWGSRTMRPMTEGYLCLKNDENMHRISTRMLGTL